MGCTGSKQAQRDLRRSPSPLSRSRSAPTPRNSDARHVVALTSSTLGSLELGPVISPDSNTDEEMKKRTNDRCRDILWSEMIKRRIPRTPTMTPPNELETINTWELMEGLEDISPLVPSAIERHSFSFCTIQKPTPVPEPEPSSKLGDFDPIIKSTFRKALNELSPQHPILLRSPERSEDFSTGIVRARVRAFQEKIDAKKAVSSHKCPYGGEGKVVVYFTSLRGVRKTYEDSCWVRGVLKEYGVWVDERDVSMDRGYRDEMNEMIGSDRTLPRVFADGRYVGGVEEVRRMHEGGELGKVLQGCEVDVGEMGRRAGSCEGCGDVRFVLCGRCSGSCKVFVEEEEEEVEGEEDEEEVGGGFRQCPDCNENGIVRCPVCC